MTKYILERGKKMSNWERCNCGNLSEMYCVCEGAYDTLTHDPEAFEWGKSYFKVLICPSCRQLLILRYTTFSNDIYDDEIRQQPYEEYTRQVLYSPVRQRHYSIPSSISDVLTQAEKVVPTSPRAALILCRAALDELCRDKNIPETRENSKGRIEYLDLKKRLNLLLEREKLSSDLREIMHGIRVIGNEYAHGSEAFLADKISQDEVEALIGLVDYVLNRLYVDKARSDEAVKDINSLKEKVLNAYPKTKK